jgi:hypothetical protein
MKELHLLGKLVQLEDCPVLLKSNPGSDWQKDWQVMAGEWCVENGWLIGAERGNKGGILFSRQSFDCDVIFSFTAKTVLPATRDVNGVFCAHWDQEIDYLGNAYVFGFNGWYEHKSGIERNPQPGLNSISPLYHYEPGTEIHMIAGAVNGHCFMVVDDVLITELYDPNPLVGGHVGFSPYCTKLRIKDIEVREIKWENFPQTYEPEF